MTGSGWAGQQRNTSVEMPVKCHETPGVWVHPVAVSLCYTVLRDPITILNWILNICHPFEGRIAFKIMENAIL